MKRSAPLLLAVALWSAPPAQAGYLAFFRTTFGDMEVELFEQDKPATVRNFLYYTRQGYYQNTLFHRCPTNYWGFTDFVAQGGLLSVYNLAVAPQAYVIPTIAPITNEFFTGRFFSNSYGTIAMAKTSHPDSATSSFFFNLGDNSLSLDNTNNSGGFTVFGRVRRGTNTLNQFIGRYQNYGLQAIDFGSGYYFPDMPVNYYGYKPNIYFSDLVYATVELLETSITRTNNANLIRWRSVAGLLNQVETATNLPPVWRPLWSATGNGAVMSHTDASDAAPLRLYRVRVDY